MKIKYVVLIARTDNLGDNAQTQALYNIYKYMGIADNDIIFLNIENVLEKIENDTIYIVPCVMVDIHYLWFIEYLMSENRSEQFCFIPLSIGYSRLYHFNETRLKNLRKPMIDQFISPIGFRDYDSAQMYKNIGYDVYVNGCITNTYPKRKAVGNYNKIYIIDIPKDLYNYIPESIRNRAIVLSQIFDNDIPIQEQYDMSVERYELLRDTAELVITLRYHVAVPCAAMGIPVIMVENYPGAVNWMYDIRLPALNPNVHFYPHEQWNEIDWSPQVFDYEDVKKAMIQLIVSRIKNQACLIETCGKLNDFYEPSRRRYYKTIEHSKREYIYFSYYIDDLFLSRITTNFKYYLFGLSDRYIDQEECLILNFVKAFYPKAEFLGFVDSYKTGTYFGKKVIHPNDMVINEMTYCLVSAFTANSFTVRLFEKQGFDQTHLWQMPEALLFYVYCL